MESSVRLVRWNIYFCVNMLYMCTVYIDVWIMWYLKFALKHLNRRWEHEHDTKKQQGLCWSSSWNIKHIMFQLLIDSCACGMGRVILTNELWYHYLVHSTCILSFDDVVLPISSDHISSRTAPHRVEWCCALVGFNRCHVLKSNWNRTRWWEGTWTNKDAWTGPTQKLQRHWVIRCFDV